MSSLFARSARLVRVRPATALLRSQLPSQNLIRLFASKSYPAHVVIDMPALSPTMTAGNVGVWKKAVGDELAPGDALCEIETDKATMDFEFQDEGFLAKILLPEGTKDVPIGKPLGVYVEEASDVAAFADFTAEDAGAAIVGPTSEPPAAETPAPAPTPAPAAAAPAPAATPAPSAAAPVQAAPAPANGRVFASARAKLFAKQAGYDIAAIQGSGPNGRVIARDVESYTPAAAPAASAAASAAAPAAPTWSAAPVAAAYKDIQVSSMRKTIAQRLTQSKQVNPDFIVSSTVSVSKLLQVREALNKAGEGAYKISVNDLLVKAISLASKKVPQVNSHWIESEGVIREYTNVDVSIAVATETGLITPVVKSANQLGLAEISSTAKELGAKARANRLTPEEYQGGTITISNLGMNNAVSMFTAIINPPQSAIISVGTVERRAIEDPEAESGISFDDVITITGTFDHKVVDGAVGGEYMKTLKSILESPLSLML